MTTVACVDVGGTGIKAGVMVDTELVGTLSVPTPAPGTDVGQRLIEAVHGAVAELERRHGRFEAVGLGVPGIVDAAAGVAVYSGNMGWRDLPLARMLSERTGLPVAFGHDITAAGVAEARLGSGVGFRDVAFIGIGTGIAAAFVEDGRAYARARPIFELGHLNVGGDDVCVCGLVGCLETVGSARAVGERFSALVGRSTSAAALAAEVRAGDPRAVQVWAEAVRGIAVGIAALAATVAPELVVVGGGLARSGDLLLEPLRDAVDAMLSFHSRPELRPAAFGQFAGCVGAGLMALDVVAAEVTP